jgi:hypothetical protein
MHHSHFSETNSGRLASLGLGFLLAVEISAKSAALPASPQDNVRSLYQTLLATMKNSRRRRALCAPGAGGG